MSDGGLTPPVGPDDHVRGNDAARVTLVEYGDYECPYCGLAYRVVKSLQRSMGDELRFVFRNFPLRQSHPHAAHAAESAEAVGAVAGEGAFWKMHDVLFESQDALDDADLVRYARKLGVDRQTLLAALERGTYGRRVRKDFRSGVRSGVNATPTFFVNGERYDGDWNDAETFLEALT